MVWHSSRSIAFNLITDDCLVLRTQLYALAGTSLRLILKVGFGSNQNKLKVKPSLINSGASDWC